MSIKIANIYDVENILQLTYKVHGYTLIDSWMYDPTTLQLYIQSGRIKYFLATDDTQTAVAMVSIFYPDPKNFKYGIIGTLFTDPKIRNINSGILLNSLIRYLVKSVDLMAENDGLEHVICYIATVHQHTQRLIKAIDKIFPCVTVGLYIDWAPAWSDIERSNEMSVLKHRQNLNITPKIFIKRRSNLVTVRHYKKNIDPYIISIPKAFQTIATKIYNQLKIPVIFANNQEYYKKSEIETHLQHHRNSVIVEVLKISSDTIDILLDKLNHFKNGLLHVIHFAIPLRQGGSALCIEKLIERGCKFAAILPFYKGRDDDMLILQYLDHIQHDLLKNQLYSIEAKQIHSLCF